MEALARAKRLRTEALTAQAARLAEGTARTVRNAERAKKHGMVEKSAGEFSKLQTCLVLERSRVSHVLL